MKNLTLKSTLSASRWGEAYPLGNGHMGAMVYGNAPVSEILFSENTFYSGEINGENNQKGAAQAFERMREAAQDDDYEKVHREAEGFIGVRGDYGTNLPVGRLFLDYGIAGQRASLSERSLNIRTGLAENCYRIDTKDGKNLLTETSLVSHPHGRFAVRIAAKTEFSLGICWEACNVYGMEEYVKGGFRFTCHAYETMHCDENTGVTLFGEAALETDGSCQAQKGGILIKGATEVIIFLTMQTDFLQKAGLQKNGLQKGEHGREILGTKIGWEELKEVHCKDVTAYMERIELMLSGKEFQQIVFEYQYGRYLLLSSSREDSLLPAHLQGIWNDSVACNIGWTCDMHLDINTQMNYWISEPCGLAESSRPLISWMKELLVPQGQKTAEISYGRPGWAAELVSNAWGFAAPYWASPIAPCPTGGIWAMMQLWEHYLYSQDIDFLREDLYPMLEGAAAFFLSYVYQREDGMWISGPSISPENSFCYQGGTYQISEAPTYEILMIRELFLVYRKASGILRETGEAYQKAGNILKNLLPYRILSDGTIAEYSKDLKIPDSQHRHTSHLLGLFPFSQINPKDTPRLCEAAEETIKRKLAPKENWEDTGWARSLLVLYEARLLNGAAAYGHLNAMLTGLLEPNGMIFHPPTRGTGAFDHVYELDGNTGLTMGITEMLMQSREGEIHLLPAWPKEMSEGSIRGLKARGGVEISFAWKNKTVASVQLISKTAQAVTIKWGGESMCISLKAHKPWEYQISIL